ncbi:hypothetical protein [Sphingomonas sp. CLY1604]|uniref:hypothetical protein n=1 Tax=Sphingomonas sp. CLY1604 TaxID=3457786 RepID=UPI003FD81A91
MHLTSRRPLFVCNVHLALSGEAARRIAMIAPSIDDLLITGLEMKVDRISETLLTVNELVSITEASSRLRLPSSLSLSSDRDPQVTMAASERSKIGFNKKSLHIGGFINFHFLLNKTSARSSDRWAIEEDD